MVTREIQKVTNLRKKKKKREIVSKYVFGNLRKKWWIPYRERG